MSIYITGDTHADFHRFSTKIFPEQAEMTKDDYVIICGDFGGVWDGSKRENYWLDWLEDKPFTLLFVDGNHENHQALKEMEMCDWNGGKAHFVRPSIIHLMRGQVFTICGKRFFTFGGARSHDIQGGVLDRNDPDFDGKRRFNEKEWIPYRILNESWWPEEMPDESEFSEGRRNLEAADWDVDFIITHATASSHLPSLSIWGPDALTDYLEEIRNKCHYKKWLFGHYHDNKNVTEKDILIYEQIIRIL